MDQVKRYIFPKRNALRQNPRLRSLYTDENNQYIPNTEFTTGDIVLKINSLGCIGPEIKSEVPTIAFFGDCQVVGRGDDSWINHLKIDGYQILNAAMDGANYERVLQKCTFLKKHGVKFDLMVVCLGWPEVLNGHNEEGEWLALLEQLNKEGRLIMCTPFCSILEECRTRGLIEHSCGRFGLNFGFMSELGGNPSPKVVSNLLDRFNALSNCIREFCSKNQIPLIDFNREFQPKSYETITDHFNDPIHFQRRGYEVAAKYAASIIHKEIRNQTEQKNIFNDNTNG